MTTHEHLQFTKISIDDTHARLLHQLIAAVFGKMTRTTFLENALGPFQLFSIVCVCPVRMKTNARPFIIRLLLYFVSAIVLLVEFGWLVIVRSQNCLLRSLV